jgi:hypothetical protein
MATKCKKCDDCVPKRGERGLRGLQGEQGPAGPQGPQGVVGPQGPQGSTGSGNDVTLGSVGTGESIVNDGVGPALFTKSIVEGDGISVTSNLTTVTISAIPLYVEISPSVRGLEANVTGGRAPYTYTWYMADWTFGGGVSMWQLGVDPLDPTNPAKVLPSANPAIINVFDACSSSNTGRAGMAKVVVTDSEGTKASDTYFLYLVGCL